MNIFNKVTPGLEELFTTAKSKKKEDKDLDLDLGVDDAATSDLSLNTGSLPGDDDTKGKEIFALYKNGSGLNEAVAAFSKLEPQDKAKAEAYMHNNLPEPQVKAFMAATKAYMTSDETSAAKDGDSGYQPVKGQEVTDPSAKDAGGLDALFDEPGDSGYTPVKEPAPEPGEEPDLGLDVKQRVNMEARHYVQAGIGEATFVKNVSDIFGNKITAAEAKQAYALELKAFKPKTMMDKTASLDQLLKAAAAYKEPENKAEAYLKSAAESKSGTEWLQKTAATLDEKGKHNPQHPTKKLFNNDKTTQESGITPTGFPGQRAFQDREGGNSVVETVFPQQKVEVKDIFNNRQVTEKMPKIKDKENVTIAVMQPFFAEDTYMGTTTENDMRDFFFNGDNIYRTPKTQTEPTGTAAHTTQDFIGKMDDLSKDAPAPGSKKKASLANSMTITAEIDEEKKKLLKEQKEKYEQHEVDKAQNAGAKIAAAADTPSVSVHPQEDITHTPVEDKMRGNYSNRDTKFVAESVGQLPEDTILFLSTLVDEGNFDYNVMLELQRKDLLTKDDVIPGNINWEEIKEDVREFKGR